MADEQRKSKDSKDDKNLEKRLKAVLGLRDKIDEALNKVYRKGDLTQKQVSDYLDNPDNFKKGQWDYIQKRRKKVFSFIWDALGSETKKKYDKKELAKKAKKRKRKSIGHRRKWIQMD
jgi:hypothetical protein